MRLLPSSLTFGIVLLLSSCANFTSPLSEPEIKVSSFRMLPSQSLNPSFEVGLQITNPNSLELNLEGLAYSVRIEGNKVFSGVANQLPVIQAYGSGDVTLQGKADLLGGLSLLNRLINRAGNTKTLSYSLEIKMKLKHLIIPITVNRNGEFSPFKRQE